MGKKWVKRIEPSDEIEEWVPVVVEISRGSQMKYELDEDTGQLRLSRALGLKYPADYGFIPRTRSGDAERMDMFVVASEPIVPLTIVRVRAIGGVNTKSTDEEEVKLIGVAVDDPAVAEVRDVEQLPGELRDAVTRFLRDHKKSEGETVDVTGWFGRDDAIEAIRHGLRAAKKRR
jgi:inorganic pyrophosphatase